MHPAARQRVAHLLDESRSVELFIKEVVAPYAGGSGVTLDELNEAYVEWCGDRGWEPEPHERFSGKSKDLLRSVHRLSVCNGIEREGGVSVGTVIGLAKAAGWKWSGPRSTPYNGAGRPARTPRGKMRAISGAEMFGSAPARPAGATRPVAFAELAS